MVALAQSAEHRIVAPKVTGSSPVGHPTNLSVKRPSGGWLEGRRQSPVPPRVPPEGVSSSAARSCAHTHDRADDPAREAVRQGLVGTSLLWLAWSSGPPDALSVWAVAAVILLTGSPVGEPRMHPGTAAD